MTEFLVDTENVANNWCDLLGQAEKNDRFVLFYTERSAHIPIDLLRVVKEQKCKMEYIRCRMGENALDFQLVTELGMRAAQTPSHTFVVVSKDHGFDCTVEYLREKGIDIRRTTPVSNAMQMFCKKIANVETQKNEEPKVEPDKVVTALPISACREAYLEMMPGENDKEKKAIADVLVLAMAEPKNRKDALMRKLRDKYGHEESQRIYQNIKDVASYIDIHGPYPKKK